jgi:hypothetical protein
MQLPQSHPRTVNHLQAARMDTVPFHFDSHGGFGEVKGLARLDEYGLELQFSTRDAVFGVIKSDMRSLRIPLEALLSVRFSAGFLWLMPSIELRVRDLAVLAGLPESEEGRVKLRVKFGERHDARAFVRDLEAMRTHFRIQMLDRTLDRMTQHLPGREPPPAPLQTGSDAQPSAAPQRSANVISMGSGPLGSRPRDPQSEG